MDALAACSTLRVDQAAIIVLLRRRYVIAPMPMTPTMLTGATPTLSNQYI
jgi:hypothetical protein